MYLIVNNKLVFQSMGFYLLFLFFLVACQNNHPEDSQTICASQFCNAQGKNEILATKDKAYTPSIIQFPANLVIASPNTNDYSKYIKIIDTLNTKLNKSGINILLNPNILRVNQKKSIDRIGYSDKIRKELESKIKTKYLTFVIVPSGQKLNGFTYTLNQNFWYYLGFGYNYIYISDNSNVSVATFAHETGHFFGLQHTFGSSSEQFTTKESILENNCNTEGDFICDTPADYNTPIDKNCRYVGARYKNYNPPIENFMSYSPGFCRNHYSNEQLIFMGKFAKSYRFNIAKSSQ